MTKIVEILCFMNLIFEIVFFTLINSTLSTRIIVYTSQLFSTGIIVDFHISFGGLCN